MNRTQIIQNLKVSGRLKGKKPAVIFLKKNIGGIYNKGIAYFVMTEKKGILNFQRLTFFTKSLKPEEDFSIDLKDFKKYVFVKRKIYTILCLYNAKKEFIEINCDSGIPDTYQSEQNIKELIDLLDEMGLKEIKASE